MKKQWIFGVVFLALLGLSVAYLALSREPANETVPQSATTSESAQPATESSSNTGDYIDYADGVIASTEGTKILFFHAPWCPQCRALEADIQDQGVPADTTVIKVDYDSNQELRQQYGVTLQTTTVLVNDEGQEVDKFVAYDSPTLDAVLAALNP